MELFKRIVREEEGQDLIEYALIAGLIAVVCFAAIQATGNDINSLWGVIKSDVESIPGVGG